MTLILTFVRDMETPEDGFVQFYAPDSRFDGSEIGPDNAVQMVLAVEEWERIGRPDHFGSITLLPFGWENGAAVPLSEPQPVDADGALIPTPDATDRPHTLSKDCWCNPAVETV